MVKKVTTVRAWIIAPFCPPKKEVLKVAGTLLKIRTLLEKIENPRSESSSLRLLLEFLSEISFLNDGKTMREAIASMERAKYGQLTRPLRALINIENLVVASGIVLSSRVRNTDGILVAQSAIWQDFHADIAWFFARVNGKELLKNITIVLDAQL